MAESIVSFAMETLWSLLKEEANLLYGVSDQINELCQEFKRMECFLQDAEARQHTEERVRNWIREIRNLAFRAENVIENYAVGVSSRKGKGFKKVCKKFACILSEAKTLHKIGIEIGDIKAKIAGVRTSLDTYGIKALDQAESSSNATTRERERWLRMTYPHEVVEDSFVGMKDDIEQLMSLILDEETHHPVVSIWGMGGSGKTTVARKIYNDERIKGHFDALAWVCISQLCQVRKVLEEIMQQLLNDPKRIEEIKLMGDVRLVGELYKQQKEKKCLVVLDDIWKIVDWDCLQSAFPIREAQGTILLTTRNKEVAEIGFAHNLSYLTQDEGWELLQKKALITDYYRSVQDSDIEIEREKMGRKMVDKCGYLPLAISVLGGILRKKQSLYEWRKVSKDVEFYLSREGADETKGIMWILSLSYDVLPYHLKQCFLSLSHFPEDFEIGVLSLCLRWMGEGIVLSKSVGRGETLLEVAEEYLIELASRSMVILSLRRGADVLGLKYEYCQLHDLMHELCLNKCSQEDFFKKVEFQDESKSESFSIEQLNPYRLGIYSSVHLDQKAHNTITQIGQQQNSQHLRSLEFIDTSTQRHQPKQMESSWTQLFNNLKYLRILQFEGFEFVDKATLQSIQKLIHLRFIYFEDCLMDEPPLQLLNLPYLQTVYILNSEWMNPAKVANNVMWKAKRLRHLIFYADEVDKEKKLVDQGKLRLRGLFQLQLIWGFDTGKMEATDLTELSNLRWFMADILDNDSLYLILNCIEENRWPHIQTVQLGISGCHLSSLKDDEDEDGIMTNSINLVSKVFSCRKLHLLSVDGSLGNKLPKYEPHIASCLVTLQLTNSEIMEDPMETLEKLPNLTRLFLLEDAFVGKEMVCNKMGFPKLEILELDKLHNLEKWRIEEGSMPILSRLDINGCEKLEMIPNGLKFVSTLKELYLISMPLEFVCRIHSADQGNEGADFHKIRHVPSVYIY